MSLSAEDQLAIRQRIEAYSAASFEGDVEAWLDCFTEDGVRSMSGVERRGKKELRAFWDDVWPTLESIAFFTEVGPMQGSGETATVRVYAYEVVVMKGGMVRKFISRFDDRLVRQGDVWRFSYREHTTLFDEAAR